MKQYHTALLIKAPIQKVWNELTHFGAYPEWNPLVGKLEGEMIEGKKISTFIIPLNKTYHPVVIEYKPNESLIWKGVQGASFLLAGKHYYKLEKLNATQTQLHHGEWFTGLFSHFINKKLLNKMENAFIQHNELLKQRIENEK